MASQVVCGLIFRLLLPICLAVACMFRYNGLSLVYLIYLLLIPLFAEPTRTSMQGHTGRLLKSLCIISMTFLILQIIYQITISSLLARKAIDPNFNCTTWEKSMRQLGFDSVEGADAGNGIRVFIPDIGMFMAGIGTWLVCRKMALKPASEDMAKDNIHFEGEDQGEDEDEEEETDEKLGLEESILLDEDFDAEDEREDDDEILDEEEEEEKESTKMKILHLVAGAASKVKEIIGHLITTAGQVVVTVLLGFTGIMLPSVTSAVYFFTFLGLCTWWSFGRTFNTLMFSCLCVLMAIFSAGHLTVLYLYQFQFFQENVLYDSATRAFGISTVIQSNCSNTWQLSVHRGLKPQHYMNPIMLLVLYYTLATLIRLWLQEPIAPVCEDGGGCEDRELECAEHMENSVQKKRSLWRKARYATEERNLLSTLDGYSMSDAMVVTSNGNSFGFISPDNGPGALDLYSTPQYKVDRVENGSEEKKEDIVVGVSEKSAETEKPEEGKKHTLATIFNFIMMQSYICALIAMMAWSITYVSWFTFVFLIWSCALWIVRDRRKYAMLTSPFMVIYGDLVIVLQYIWSFEGQKEISGLSIESKRPFPELASKMLYLLTFWLLLRQALTERKQRQERDKEPAALSDVIVEIPPKEEEEEEEGGDGEKEVMKVLGNLVMSLFIKYWIYMCGGMFFFVSFEGTMVMYKIIYMMMFLFCVALYQVNYDWWRRILKYFWMSVVVYTMLVLVLIYTFQFKNSPGIWKNMTKMTDQSLEDLGLKHFKLGELFKRILIPTSFLLVCNIHLHYFHERFLRLTDLNAVAAKQESSVYRLAHPDGSLADITMMSSSPGAMSKEEEAGVKVQLEPEVEKESLEPDSKAGSRDQSMGTEPSSDQSSDLKNKWHLVVDRLTVLFLKFLEYFHKLQLFIWWLLELHIIKFLSAYIVAVCIEEVSLFNLVFLACWAFALPYSQLRPLASCICTVWTCVVIVCKMLYQLKSITVNYTPCEMKLNYSVDKRNEMNGSLLYQPIDSGKWVGMQKTSPLLVNLRNHLLMLAFLAFEVTITRHQTYFRLRNNLIVPPARNIFHDITHQHLDDGIINCAKYFINYFFYKFGLETCFLLVINVIGQRMDFYAVLHAFSLGVVMYRRRRKAIAEIWPKYCCFLACMLTFQYCLCIGIPPAACKDYPWRFPGSTLDSNMIKWLYFPDFHTWPTSRFLIYDFMLLLCASLQRQIFDDENKAAVRLMAGDNVEICRDLDAAAFSLQNPVPNFIHCRSYLDMFKVIMFSYLFWFVLTIIFITGTTRISIFCMGYLVACFYFLLFGGELLLKPSKKILRYWDFLIAYNMFVITMKNILSIAACGYLKTLKEKSCWVIQLFSLACTIKGYETVEVTHSGCEMPRDEAGIIWDSICFAFLLLQRRVFMSYYFLHVVADIRASQILASRGAELFQANIVKRVRARLEEESKSMDQLKKQMDRIKTRQEKFKKGKQKMLSVAEGSGEGQNLVQEEPEPERKADKEKPKTKKKLWWRPWVDHASMVRSGEYYLFESDSEEEEEEEEKKDEEGPKKSAFQFLYHAWITNPKTALKERGKGKRKFWKRYTGGYSKRKDRKEDHVAIEVGEQEDEEGSEDGKKSNEPDNIIKRVFNIIKFTWVLFLTTLESLTVWLNSMCREHIDISTVLRIERCMLTREVKKGNVPSRESIQVYYQKQLRLNLSRESGLDRLDEEDSTSGSHRARHRRAGYRMESQDSMASRDSMSSNYTEATMLFSRQSTLDDLDGMSESIPKTSERARPKLRKMYSLDMSTASTDSGSSAVSSEATQSIMLYSRQGTTDTIEEVEDEQDQEVHAPHSPRERAEEMTDEGEWRDGAEETTDEGEWRERTEETTDEGRWRERVDETTDEREWRERTEEMTDKGGWSERVDETTDEGGWKERTEETTDEGGWRERVDEMTDEGGWRDRAEETTAEGGLRERTDEMADEGEWRERADETADEDRWRERVDETADEGEWRERVDETADEDRWRDREEGCVSESEAEVLVQTAEDSFQGRDGDGKADDAGPDPVGCVVQLTPDTDGAASYPTDGEVPPSYSKAVSFDRLSTSSGGLSVSSDTDDEKRLMIMTPDSRSDGLDEPLLPSIALELTASELLLNKMFYDEELEDSEKFFNSQPQLMQLCYAIYNMLVARSEMVCYLVIILNHMISASLATLILPVLIFLWAMLSVPRPSKRFWMTAIVYTEVTIVIKYFFQFSFFPFNKNLEISQAKPYHPPNIIGVEKKDGYVLYDLLQLLALFFHRSILKCHGLWDEEAPSEEQKDGLHKDESEDEAQALIPSPDGRGSVHSLKSINLATSLESVQVCVPEHRTYQRRKSSGTNSHITRRSSRSIRDSTSTRTSSRRGSIPSIHRKTRKELLLEKLKEQLIKAKAFIIKKTLEIYHPIRQFFYNLIHPEYSAVTDVYVLMFLADTVDFIITVFGFWAFGKNSGSADITSSLSEDQVPGPFLVMVLIQFGTMVVDRALYLRKTVLGKVIFQVILVFGIHFWMFFILPGVTERRFNQNRVAQIWYFVKCIYFGLSAYQIRCGYPTRVLGNFLTKSYNYVNLFLFQGFRMVPFLTELRAVMDWVWTDTTLSLSSWICVEDIYAHIFILKCWRESEKRYPQPRGQKKKKVVKYGMGGMIVMLLICIVWFPLLFMSLVKSVAGVVNQPLDVSVTITLGGLQPIFTMSAQQNHLLTVDSAKFKTFKNKFEGEALQFLDKYTHDDLTIAVLEGSSSSLWTISPPSMLNLKKDLINTNVTVTISWIIQRKLSLGAKSEYASQKYTIQLDFAVRDQIKSMLNGTRNTFVVIPKLFPRYIRARSDSDASPVKQMYIKDKKLTAEAENLRLTLHRADNSSGDTQLWWIVDQENSGQISLPNMKQDRGKEKLELYVFNDKVSPPSLGFLAGYGIMGLYASVVLVIGKFVREFFSGISHTIMFEELPCVDRILKLCTDIFLVRETGELDLEEDLYAKLIFLYRSPETMIKWTREKDE
ncbi:piezo-type mechanosensitive ion channel component 2-like [Conger conger]|uniref:piezo-type mechanosensitive ion channel component 2-like n=1 Tax=Conger conger TaxID=82655 RepID=UPI002A5A7583|nr:piezo-type mechanosensitive ion channel component 2-like [Conger conger]